MSSLLSYCGRWYLHNFLRGFCYHFVLLILFLVPPILGLVGVGHGAQHQFAHDDGTIQFVGGVSLGLYWIAILFCGYMLHLRAVRRQLLAGPEVGSFGGYATGVVLSLAATILVFLVLAFVGGWMFETFGPPSNAEEEEDQAWRRMPSPVEPGAQASATWEVWLALLVLLGVIAGPGLTAWAGGAIMRSRYLGFAALLLALGLFFVVEAAVRWRRRLTGLLGVAWLGLIVLGALAWPLLGGVLAAGLATWVLPSAVPLAARLGAVAKRSHYLGLAVLLLALALALFVATGASWAALGVAALVALALLARRVGAARGLGRWAGQALLLGLWLGVILWGLWGREGALAWLRLGLLATGMALTFVGLAAARRTWRARSYYVWLAVLINAAVVYAGVMYTVSHCPLGILSGAAVGAALLLYYAAATRALAPELCEQAADWARRRFLARPESEQALVRLAGAFAVAFVVPWVVALAFDPPPYFSAVPIVLLVWLSVAALYGACLYVLPRALFVVVGALLFAGLLAHVHPYRMRFPGMGTELYNPALDLEAHIAADVAWQDEFERLIGEYEKADQAPADESEEEEQKRLARREGLENELREVIKRMGGNRVRGGRYLSQTRERFSALPPLRGPGLRTRELELWPGGAGPAGARAEPWPRKSPLVVITVSGGGIRSAVWTFAVLKNLERALALRGIDFPSHVRLIAGASGGMVGAAYYVATLPEAAQRQTYLADYFYDAELQPDYRYSSARNYRPRAGQLDRQQAALGGDALTPLVRRAALSDLPGWFSPWALHYDRGRALEEAWSRLLGGALEVPFAQLRTREQRGDIPSLAFTPMLVEDGRRLVISNLDLGPAISNNCAVYTHFRSHQLYNNLSTDALELFRLWPRAHSDFSLATAARMNASFPYFSPAVALPSRPRRRVVDAGYYDNYGVSLAASWLSERSTESWRADKGLDSVLFIQIRDGISEPERQLRRLPPADPSRLSRVLSPSGRSLEELSSPLEGLYSSWSSSSMFRNDALLKKLSERYNRGLRRDAKVEAGTDDPSPDDLIRFLVVNFELDARVSLSWYLSEAEKQDLARAEDKIVTNLLRIADWWFRDLGTNTPRIRGPARKGEAP